MKALPVEFRRLEKRKSSHYISLGKCKRILDASVYMAFGSKVDDARHMLVLHQLIHPVEVADISLDKFVVRFVFYVFQCCKIACIGKLVDVNYVVFRIFVDEKSYNVGADETGTAGDDDRTVHIILYQIFQTSSYYS